MRIRWLSNAVCLDKLGLEVKVAIRVKVGVWTIAYKTLVQLEELCRCWKETESG